MEKVFVDTSGWMAYFCADDQNHEAAVAVYGKIKKSRSFLYTSDYILDETLTLIMARAGHADSVKAGETIFQSEISKIVHVSEEDVQKAWHQFKKYKDQAFSFTDVTSFVVMRDLAIRRAFTFDRDFLAAGFQLFE